jgi:hypothetical protein
MIHTRIGGVLLDQRRGHRMTREGTIFAILGWHFLSVNLIGLEFSGLRKHESWLYQRKFG